MSIGLLFWVIMIIGLLFNGYSNRANFGGWAMGNLVLRVLLALLAWKVFGQAVHQ